MEALFKSMAWLGVALLAWQFYGPHRQYWIDRTRYRLFAARDGLFQAAADEVLPFDAEAYGLTRNTLNGMIRFVEELGFWRLLLMTTDRRMRDLGREHSERHSRSIRDLSPEGRRAIETALIEANEAVLRYLVASSFPLFVLSWVVFAGHRLESARQSLNRRSEPALRVANAQAYSNSRGGNWRGHTGSAAA